MLHEVIFLIFLLKLRIFVQAKIKQMLKPSVGSIPALEKIRLQLNLFPLLDFRLNEENFTKNEVIFNQMRQFSLELFFFSFSFLLVSLMNYITMFITTIKCILICVFN